MKSKRRAWVIVGLLAVALVAVAVPLAKPVWWWVALGRFEVSRPGTRGFEVRNRWTGTLHRAASWYEDNGFKYSVTFLDGSEFCVTNWNHDGSVDSQMRNRFGKIQTRFNTAPPWWWGVQDQTSPSDPQWITEHGK